MRSHAPLTFAISPLRLSNDDEGRRQTAIVDQLPAVERRVLFDYGRPPRRLARSNLPERARASMLRMTRFLRIWGSGVRISSGAPLNNLKHMRFFSSASQFIGSDFSRGPKADPRELKIASDMPIPMAVSSGDHGLVRLRAGVLAGGRRIVGFPGAGSGGASVSASTSAALGAAASGGDPDMRSRISCSGT
jgi:hypothetical protein